MIGLVGFAICGLGLWWYEPWLALVAIGAALLWAGIRGATHDA